MAADTKRKIQVPRQTEKALKQTTWGGAHIAGNDWSFYTGTSAALFSHGWRVRLIGGYSSYSYQRTQNVSGQSTPVKFKGQSGFGDILLGYRWKTGDFILKAFAGIHGVGHAVIPFDPENAAIGYQYGGMTALEIWLNVSERHWLSADASYATVFNRFDTTIRTGYRLWPKLSLGLEAGLSGNDDYIAARAAGMAAAESSLFAKDDSYLRVSAGGSADRDMDLSPYAAVSFAVKY